MRKQKVIACSILGPFSYASLRGRATGIRRKEEVLRPCKWGLECRQPPPANPFEKRPHINSKKNPRDTEMSQGHPVGQLQGSSGLKNHQQISCCLLHQNCHYWCVNRLRVSWGHPRRNSGGVQKLYVMFSYVPFLLSRKSYGLPLVHPGVTSWIRKNVEHKEIQVLKMLLRLSFFSSQPTAPVARHPDESQQTLT